MWCARLGQAATASLEGQQNENNNKDKWWAGSLLRVYRQSQALQTMGIGTSCFALTSTFAKLPNFSGKQALAWLLLFFCFELVGEKWLHMKRRVNVVFWSN